MPQVVISSGVPYISLEIQELENTLVAGTNDSLNKSFAILTPGDIYGSSFTSTAVRQSNKIEFNTEKAMLNKLTIQFRKPDGTLFDFGTDTSTGTAVTESVQVVLFLKIVTKVPTSSLNRTFFN